VYNHPDILYNEEIGELQALMHTNHISKNVGIAKQQKAGIQGRDDGIKEFRYTTPDV